MRTTLRSALVPAVFVLVAACGPATQQPSPCDDLQPGGACFSQEALDDCLAAEDECPGNVVTMESCPPQFACGS
jgi:hypothetical protein